VFVTASYVVHKICFFLPYCCTLMMVAGRWKYHPVCKKRLKQSTQP